jgi:signal transduction histidine kinase
MKKNDKKKRTLIFQISILIFPLFTALTLMTIWSMNDSMVDAFLDAKNPHTKLFLNQAYAWVIEYNDQSITELYMSICEKDQIAMLESYTEEEEESIKRDYDDYIDENYGDGVDIYGNGIGYSEFILNSPYNIKQYGARNWHHILIDDLETYSKDDIYSHVFLMDVTEPYFGMVLGEGSKDGESRQLGDKYEIDLSDHPALKQIMESDSDEIRFEQSVNFPDKGHYYIAYKPVLLEGKLRAVFCLAYRWDDFIENMAITRRNTILINISGILVVVFILNLTLYKLAIKPILHIDNALIQYTDDKDSKKIVKEMYGIKSKNEIGYLADVISDLALEIDLYTKENIRIATAQANAEAARERAEKELYEAKVSVMVSQIQPHFMYNALTSIAMMCMIDPKKAHEATITFSKYLRGNMDSLKQSAPVPFTQELEHLKKYLYIEKLRFADKLNIEYEIGPTDFVLPLLSVQPLVENAVKHGVGMKKKGGTVKISTRETETAFEVIISDDGVGFDTAAPQKDDGRSHVGMDNTRTRLKELCSGEVKIESTVGEGTTATIILPKEGQPNEDPVS